MEPHIHVAYELRKIFPTLDNENFLSTQNESLVSKLYHLHGTCDNLSQIDFDHKLTESPTNRRSSSTLFVSKLIIYFDLKFGSRITQALKFIYKRGISAEGRTQ